MAKSTEVKERPVTIGRMVYYYRGKDDHVMAVPNTALAAIVVGVNASKKTVNLTVFDFTGVPKPRLNVAHESDAKEGQAKWGWPMVKKEEDPQKED